MSDEQARDEAARKYVKLLHRKKQWHFENPEKRGHCRRRLKKKAICSKLAGMQHYMVHR